MSLCINRRSRRGRVYWQAVTAWYIVNINGGDVWVAAIKNRDTGVMVEFLDRTPDGDHFRTREAVAAAAERYIVDHPVPA